MKSVFGVVPDSSSVEYEVFMLCQGLQVDKVLPMIGRLGQAGKGQATDADAVDMAHSMSSIHGAVAKAAGLRGEWSLARKHAKLCLEAIAAETAAPPAAEQDDGEEEEEAGGEEDGEGGAKKPRSGKQAAVGGKRAWKDMDVAREQSLTVCIVLLYMLPDLIPPWLLLFYICWPDGLTDITNLYGVRGNRCIGSTSGLSSSRTWRCWRHSWPARAPQPGAQEIYSSSKNYYLLTHLTSPCYRRGSRQSITFRYCYSRT
jgi:hypothetical protein